MVVVPKDKVEAEDAICAGVVGFLRAGQQFIKQKKRDEFPLT